RRAWRPPAPSAPGPARPGAGRTAVCPRGRRPSVVSAGRVAGLGSGARAADLASGPKAVYCSISFARQGETDRERGQRAWPVPGWKPTPITEYSCVPRNRVRACQIGPPTTDPHQGPCAGERGRVSYRGCLRTDRTARVEIHREDPSLARRSLELRRRRKWEPEFLRSLEEFSPAFQPGGDLEKSERSW